MQAAAVYDLSVAKPHEPPDARFTPEQFAIYREGYQMALVKSLQAIDYAGQRWKLRLRTTRLDAKRKRASEQSGGRS
jgi:hypothetical protein